MSFCRAGLGMAKTNTLVDGKKLGQLTEKIVSSLGIPFQTCRFIHGRFRFFFAWYTIKNGRGSSAVQGTFVYVFLFFSFFFVYFHSVFFTYQVWIWYNKWFEPMSEVWLCSLIISFIHQVCLGGWASAQTSSLRYRYVDVLKIALNIEKKQHHFGLLLGVEDTVDVKQ